MTMSTPRQTDTRPSRAPLSRRAALARLGLTAAVAYSAPSVMHLDRSANAQIMPSPCSNQGSGKGVPAWCRKR
jgi:hypothetical protein